MTQKVEVTQNERVLGGAAHASVILGLFTNFVGGIVVAGLIWLSQREKSRWVAFQSLQAVVYQLIGLGLGIVAFGCWFLFYMASLIPLIAQADRYQDAPPPIFWVGLGSICIPFLMMGLWMLYGLYGAIRAYSGADFRYIVIGDWLARRRGGS
ncbi:MAG: DUF4870 domain-containing protein [Anaerolineae bacterium]|nr:DUF4870 domain-containing protein [Anaerolineae bacterium]